MPRVDLPTDKHALLLLGQKRVDLFCTANKIKTPPITAVPGRWTVSACAYYRPQYIKISPVCCAGVNPANFRNWNWPGSVTDREPFGVLAHELGHHCDWTASDTRHDYFGNYGVSVALRAVEKPITSYAPNPAEWFAEMFRLFVTNAALLELIRPKTYTILMERWKPVSHKDWTAELGGNVPVKILRTLNNKIAEAQKRK